jgi:hypothetical protein
MTKANANPNASSNLRPNADLTDIDLLRLIRSRLGDKRIEARDASREVYGRPTDLPGVMTGEKSLTPKAFVKLAKALDVRGSLLRVWLAAFLVDRDAGFLRLVKDAGLLDIEALRALKEVKDPGLHVDMSWEHFGSCVETVGRMRQKICSVLAVADKPLSAGEVATKIGDHEHPTRGALRRMRTAGYVESEERLGRVQGMHSMHNAQLVYWKIAEAGREALARSQTAEQLRAVSGA